ncbi:hypothetical protein KIN20_016945 [Parelaphostrongylus tenuis]|uniref:Transmembrane protein 65 n=1 Tax=Parelaphostrongylus tenuis TaxID=148309 RepID=A0AAD5N2I4_PARTN|nr:hypothetical protein KIN20_016945 [Parelaphostrongylus tenuis]
MWNVVSNGRMRLLASARRLASRIGSTAAASCDASSTTACPVRPIVGAWSVVKRSATTGAFHSLDRPHIKDNEAALEIAAKFTFEEQALLRDALDELAARHDDVVLPMTYAQTRSLFLINTLPFIGFGFLDNMIMIVAGQYIDQARWTTHGARAIGLSIGCIIGMFPLLFYDADDNTTNKEAVMKSPDSSGK